MNAIEAAHHRAAVAELRVKSHELMLAQRSLSAARARADMAKRQRDRYHEDTISLAEQLETALRQVRQAREESDLRRQMLKDAARVLDRFLPMAFKEYERQYPGEVKREDGYVAFEVSYARKLADILGAFFDR